MLHGMAIYIYIYIYSISTRFMVPNYREHGIEAEICCVFVLFCQIRFLGLDNIFFLSPMGIGLLHAPKFKGMILKVCQLLMRDQPTCIKKTHLAQVTNGHHLLLQWNLERFKGANNLFVEIQHESMKVFLEFLYPYISHKFIIS